MSLTTLPVHLRYRGNRAASRSSANRQVHRTNFSQSGSVGTPSSPCGAQGLPLARPRTSEPRPKRALRAALFEFDRAEVNLRIPVDQTAGRDILRANLPISVEHLMAVGAGRVMRGCHGYHKIRGILDPVLSALQIRTHEIGHCPRQRCLGLAGHCGSADNEFAGADDEWAPTARWVTPESQEPRPITIKFNMASAPRARCIVDGWRCRCGTIISTVPV